MADITNNSKKDTWLTIVIFGSIAACLAACATLVTAGAPINLLTAGLLIVIGVIFPLWIMRTTYYVLGDDRLLVRCGPFHWTAPLADIVSVKRTRNPLSGPALSLDRVQIRYGRLRSVLISPEHRERFLVDLETRRTRAAGNV